MLSSFGEEDFLRTETIFLHFFHFSKFAKDIQNFTEILTNFDCAESDNIQCHLLWFLRQCENMMSKP